MELFKESLEKYRGILERQVSTLDEMRKAPVDVRDDQWRAKHDYAVALARDVFKLVLPPSSSVYALYATATAPAASASDTAASPPSEYELELYRSALANFDWSSASSGAFPSTVSVYSEVSRALPEIIYKHWTFKVILGALAAVVLFAATGVLKFYTITLNIKQEILDKEAALSKQLDGQQKEVDAFLKSRKAEADDISKQLSLLSLALTDAKKGVAQLETDAQATLARFTAQVSRNVDVEVQKALDAAKGVLVQDQKVAAGKIDDYWTKDAQPLLKKSADTRVAEILASGWAPFGEKLGEFQTRTEKATAVMAKLEDRQKALEGKQLLLSRASSLVAYPSPRIVDRLSAYIGEALWVIYSGTLVIGLLVVINLVLLWRVRRPAPPARGR
jgi:cell division protein FtsL